jgi:hypothetical protein
LPRPPAGPHAVEKPDLSKPRKNYSQSIAIADVRSDGGRLAQEQRALFVHWELDRKIEEAAAAHPDFFISESLPGAGAALAPRLLAAFGSQRERCANAEEVQAYTGIAPVTERKEEVGTFSLGVSESSCGRAFARGLVILSLTRIGFEATIDSSGSAARGTARRCESWLSNGSASFSVAGQIGWFMTKANIWPRSPNETHRSLRLLGRSCEISVDTL